MLCEQNTIITHKYQMRTLLLQKMVHKIVNQNCKCERGLYLSLLAFLPFLYYCSAASIATYVLSYIGRDNTARCYVTCCGVG